MRNPFACVEMMEAAMPLGNRPVAFALLICLFFAASVEAQTPQWLWLELDEQGQDPDQQAEFTREFELDEPVSAARLTLLAESARITLHVNGQRMVEHGPYDQVARFDITSTLKPGKNRIEARGVATSGPSAFFAALEISFANGRQRRIVSDASWTARPGKLQPRGLVDRRLLLERARQIGVTATDNYEQWKRAIDAKAGTNPASFVTRPGVQVKLVRSSRSQEGSWVSLTFDDQGRAIIAMEKQGLWRFTLDGDSGEVDRVERINDSLKECRGLQFIDGVLYANANNSKQLVRLAPKGKKFGEPEVLLETEGGVGHGRNDITLGPDGKLHIIHGDSVRIPTGVADYTSPYREARQGKATSEGHWLQLDPESKQVEVLAGGLRNPYGIALNDHGDAFTYDADAEYDMGSPWYRPTRISHLVVGGDYGWRGVTRSWPPYYPDHPDNALPNLDVGKGSPTAVLFGRGLHQFPASYQEALFVLDWAYGRVLAVHSWRRGASYLMSAETFLKGSPLNVTDLAVSPDGALYLITGGRGTQSAFYQIRFPRRGEDAATVTRQQRERAEFAERSHARRRALETMLMVDTPAAEEIREAWPSLGDADPWLRHAARNVLEQHPVGHWRERALAESDLATALTALTALARSGQDTLAVVERLNELPWSQAAEHQQTEALYLYWLATAQQTPAGELRRQTAKRLNDMLPATHYAANRLLSELVVRLEQTEQYEKILQLLEATDKQHEQMHYLFVLRHAKSLTAPQRRRYFSQLSEASGYLGGQGLPDFVRRIREESLASVPTTQREALADSIAAVSTLQESAPPTPPTRPFVKAWTLDELSGALEFPVTAERVERGRDLFHAASCTQCHRADGVGRSIGPDLTSVARRFSRRDILTSILHPSRVVAEKYRSLQVITKDGRNLVGRVATSGDYRSPILRLATDPTKPFTYVEINKNEIEAQAHSPTSWMPEGLLSTLSREEVQDLLAYLESLSR